MKRLLRESAARHLRLFGRWYVALPIFALLISSIGVAGLAQRRASIRVPAGAAEKAVAATVKKGRKNEQVRANQSRGNRPLGQKKERVLPYTPVNQDTETVVAASVGQMGVQKTTAEIMDDQANAPKVSRRPMLVPERKGPNRKILPQDPNAPAVASIPARPRGLRKPPHSTSAPQTVSTPNFLGATLADTAAFPPDSMGAVGPTQYFVFLNGRLRTLNKTTGVADGVINVDSDVFFAPVMTPPPGGSFNFNFTSDPRVRYDRLSRRWILIIIDVPSMDAIGDVPNRVLVAVSDAASNGVLTGSTVWTFFFIQQDTVGGPSTGEFLDYPTLGIDEDALYIGGNMFGAVSGIFVACSAFVVQKSSLLSGGPLITTAFRGVVAGPGAEGPWTPQGVDNYAVGTNEGYFIGVSNAFFARLVLRRITNPASMAPTISANILITTPSTTFPENVPHLGNTGGNPGLLDALDDRLFAAHIRNGRLWTAHNFEVNAAGVANAAGNRDGVRWYELNGIRSTDNGGVPVIVQSGTTFDPAATNPQYFFIPTVMVSGQGHAAFGFSRAGNAHRADAATNGRLRTDALGTTQAVAFYTASSTAYNPPADPGGPGDFPRRWGDYSMVSLDPKDDMTMWTIQEFCNSTDSYGVQVVKLLAPPPATPTTASPNNPPAGVSSLNIVITGTSVAGSEFFDPGPNIPGAEPFNHISATVSGGVTVNSVTYNSPTQVTLNISTVGTPPGPKDVTITNPDGQSTTGVGILNIVAAAPLLISEFRLRGPAGANDEYIEIYNNSGADHTVAGGGTGYAIAASDSLARCIIPNGTVIPNRGHFLCVNSAYSLAGSAAGDANYTVDIPDNVGIALFNTSLQVNFTLANRLDAVGSTSEGNATYKEGSGNPVIGSVNLEYAWVRTHCPGNAGTFGTSLGCFSGGLGLPRDSNANENDFIFVDTNGNSIGGGQRIGAPGPENLASPIQRNSSFAVLLLDQMAGASSPTNRARDFTSDPANASTFGTLDIRRRVVNNTGGNVTRLRFRIVDITTFPAPTGVADLRARTSPLVVVSGVNDSATCSPASPPCAVTVQGTTLEQPPPQLPTIGGGFNSTLSAGTVTLGTPLAPGASINVRFLLGVEQTGGFRIFINLEALP